MLHQCGTVWLGVPGSSGWENRSLQEPLSGTIARAGLLGGWR